MGNWATTHYERRLPASVTAFFRGPANLHERLHALYAEIFSELAEGLAAAGYCGPVGIDAFVYRTASGEVRLKPIVEINPRFTMGRLLVELMRQTAPGSHGLFRLLNRPMLQAEGFADFCEYAKAAEERLPIRLEGSPVARLREGLVCLNDPARAQVCLATFQVRRTSQLSSSHVL